jgi:hypothetical protein
LDQWSVPTPPNFDARYDEVSGGRSYRVIIYLVAKNFGWDEAKWRRQPWWVQRAYLEGLEADELLELVPPDIQEVDPVMAEDNELRALGLRVIDGGRV